MAKRICPSGEVFTSPIEDSVEGVVFFDLPSMFMGEAVKGIRLVVKNGEIIEWDAEIGKKLLDNIFDIPGSRIFGEAAIGLNYDIKRPGQIHPL